MKPTAQFMTTIYVEKQDGSSETFGLSSHGQGFTDINKNSWQTAKDFLGHLADVFDFQDSCYTERTLDNFKGLVRSDVRETRNNPEGFGFSFQSGKGGYKNVTFFVKHLWASPDYVKQIMKKVEKIVPEEIPSE